MTHYLVIAHGGIGAELASSLGRVLVDDPAAVFTLLVPDARAAREREAAGSARLAREQMQATGIHPVRALAGDGSPAVAVDDELRLHPGMYDAILLCTPPPGLRSWIGGDLRTQLEERAGLPTLHLHPRAVDTWSRARAPRSVRWTRWWEWTRFASTAEDRAGAAPTGRQLLPVLAMMLVYLSAGLVLAFTVNRGFLFTDAVAFLLYAAVVGGLLFLLRDGR